ncbi:unnamed protein product [Moneuplotes crassus]|uniref:AP2/ERF domain-containing protein n=1 Tax=Euplotes crassus TaxID=5936 RepID=A0AAD1UGL7_EUPCR|nr:unnamed protein product [Moneuplotes crassus]
MIQEENVPKLGLYQEISSLKTNELMNSYNYDLFITSQMLQASFEVLSQHFCLCSEGTSRIEVRCIGESSLKDKTHSSPKSHRKTRIGSLNFDEKLLSFIDAISIFKNPDEIIFIGNKKGRNRINASRKRSKYIGVCKNGPHWQALIAINKQKTYIGTYMTQELAAKAYDFYCMLIQSLKAKTNFSYTKREVEEMISHYSQSDRNENINV